MVMKILRRIVSYFRSRKHSSSRRAQQQSSSDIERAADQAKTYCKTAMVSCCHTTEPLRADYVFLAETHGEAVLTDACCIIDECFEFLTEAELSISEVNGSNTSTSEDDADSTDNENDTESYSSEDSEATLVAETHFEEHDEPIMPDMKLDEHEMTNFTVENQQLKEVISMLESKMEYMEIRLKDADDTMERFEEVLINTSVERDQLLIEKDTIMRKHDAEVERLKGIIEHQNETNTSLKTLVMQTRTLLSEERKNNKLQLQCLAFMNKDQKYFPPRNLIKNVSDSPLISSV